MLPRYFKTSVGKKVIMAVTGLGLIGFLIAHLLGNLTIYLGPDWINAYAEHLEDIPWIVIPLNTVLGLMFFAHIIVAFILSAQNRRARPVPYVAQDTVQASLASRSMIYTGCIVFLFVIYHLMHYTWGIAHPQYSQYLDAHGREDFYTRIVMSFRDIRIASVYMLALLVLSIHVGHGSSSFLQSLGVVPEGAQPKLKRAGAIFGWIIFVAYASIPFCCFFGILKPAQGGL